MLMKDLAQVVKWNDTEHWLYCVEKKISQKATTDHFVGTATKEDGKLLGEGHLWVLPTKSSYFSRLKSSGGQEQNSSYLSRGL